MRSSILVILSAAASVLAAPTLKPVVTVPEDVLVVQTPTWNDFKPWLELKPARMWTASKTRRCSTGVATCDKLGAITCLDSYLYTDDAFSCTKTCSEGYTVNKHLKECIPCTQLDPNAATCSEEGVLSCKPNATYDPSTMSCKLPLPRRLPPAA